MNKKITDSAFGIFDAIFNLGSLIRDKLKESKRKEYLAKRNEEYPIEVVSINYLGSKKHSAIITSLSNSDYYKEKAYALDELKEMAREVGAKYLVNVRLEKDTDYEVTERGGRFYYSVWKYSGDAAK